MVRFAAICLMITTATLATRAEAQVVDLEAAWLAAGQTSVKRVPARFGKGWDLRGAEVPVVVDPAVHFPYAFSLETWFRLDDPAGRSTLFSSATARRFVVSIADGSFVEVSYHDRGTDPELNHHSFGYEFAPGRWYQFVVTADPEGGICFYVDGQLAHRLPPFTNERRKSDLGVHAIGAYSISSKGVYDSFFRGVIDRTSFTAKPWSETEILARYQEAIRTVPVSPIPAQVSFVGEAVKPTGSSPEVRLKTALLNVDDRSVARLKEAAKFSRLGGAIVVSDAASGDLPAYVREQVEGDLPAEGYVLSVRPQRIDVVAADARGLDYGLDTLRQLLGLPSVPQVDIYDYPEFAYRAGLMVTNNKPPGSLADGFGKVSLRQTIEDFADNRINAIMVRIYNWAWLDDVENLARAREIVDYAKKHHLEVIPYLQCYGHAKMFTWRDVRTDHTKTVADEAVVLAGNNPAELKTPNLVITANTPVIVRLADGTEMVEGRDFEVVRGEVQVSWLPPEGVKVQGSTWGKPYVHPDGKPFAIRRLPATRIPDGTAVKVTYDVAMNSREYCPFSPVTHELVNETVRRVIELTDANHINLGMDELWTPISRAGRCCAAATEGGMTPAEVFRREINRTLAVAQSAKPGIKVMYWSDMLDPNQTPHWMPTWEAVDEQVDQIDRAAVMMPWYYSDQISHLWRAGASLDRFLDRGFTVIGASGHAALNQFIWSNALRARRHDPQRVPGFTLTTWASRGEIEVLNRGYRAYAQATWSPSRTPFSKLLQLRLELDAIGIPADLAEERWAAASSAVTAVQRRRMAVLLEGAESELRSVDAEVLTQVHIPGVDEMLLAPRQVQRLIGQ